MSPSNVCLWIFLFSTLCELCLCKEELVASDVTGSIAKIMKRHSKKAVLKDNRIRRSYLDNRVDTFPEHPVYYNKHHHDPIRQRNVPSFPSESTREGGYYSPDADFPFASGPLDLSAFSGLIDEPSLDFSSFQSRDLGLPQEPVAESTDDLGLLGGSSFDDALGSLLGEPSFQTMGDLDPLASTGPESMTKEANNIMDDFLTFLELRESGALDECLRKKK